MPAAPSAGIESLRTEPNQLTTKPLRDPLGLVGTDFSHPPLLRGAGGASFNQTTVIMINI